jgi:hypothetical protein
MTQDEIDAAKAKFLARGGTIAVVPQGVGLNLDPKQWAEAKRLPKADPRHPTYAGNTDYEREAETRQQRGVEENGYYKS